MTNGAQGVRALAVTTANIILSGDRDKIIELWHEKRGARAAADLSDRLPVAIGCWTEPFNRQ